MADDFFGPPAREIKQIPHPLKWMLALVFGAVLFALAFTFGRYSERNYNLEEENAPDAGTTVVTPPAETETVLP